MVLNLIFTIEKTINTVIPPKITLINGCHPFGIKNIIVMHTIVLLNIYKVCFEKGCILKRAKI